LVYNSAFAAFTIKPVDDIKSRKSRVVFAGICGWVATVHEMPDPLMKFKYLMVAMFCEAYSLLFRTTTVMMMMMMMMNECTLTWRES